MLPLGEVFSEFAKLRPVTAVIGLLGDICKDRQGSCCIGSIIEGCKGAYIVRRLLTPSFSSEHIKYRLQG